MYENPALDQSVAPPEPFGQADVLRLQRLHNGLSELQQQVDDGEIHPQEAEPLRQEILQQRAPLMQRQQAAQQAVQQQRKMQLMDEHATNEAMEQQAAQFRAQGLNQRVATYTDQLTGRTAHLIEESRGKVREIDFGEDAKHVPVWAAMQQGGEGGGEFDPEHPPSEGELETQNQQAEFQQGKGGAQPASGTPYQNPALDRSVPSPTPEEGFTGGGSGGASDFEGSGSGGAPEPQAAPAGQPGWKQGAWSDAEAATLQKVRAQLKAEREGTNEGLQGGLSHSQLATLYNRANASIPPAPGNSPHLQALRTQAVHSLTEHLVQNELTLQRHIQQQAAQAKAATLASDRRETAAETRDRMAKERKEHDEKISGWYDTALKDVYAESKDWAHKQPNSTTYTHDQAGRPDWSYKPEDQEAEAWKRVQQKYKRLHGEDLSIKKPGDAVEKSIKGGNTGQPAAGNAPAPTNKLAPVPKTKEEKETEAKSVQAELDKRGAIEQQRVGVNKAFDEQKAKTSSWIPRWLRMGE